MEAGAGERDAVVTEYRHYGVVNIPREEGFTSPFWEGEGEGKCLLRARNNFTWARLPDL